MNLNSLKTIRNQPNIYYCFGSNRITNHYIHLPFCEKKCHYCAFPIHAVGKKGGLQAIGMYEEYVRNIKTQIKYEMQLLSSFTKSEKDDVEDRIESIYIGGGTPSLMSPSQIDSIISQFTHLTTSQTEVTLQMNLQQVELIPQFIASNLVNRLSIGIQTLNPQTLSAFNRSTPSLPTLITKLAAYRQSNPNLNINLDFIIDFNFETKDMHSMIQCIQRIQPTHVTMYILEVNEGSYLSKKIHQFRDSYVDKYEHYPKISQILRHKYGYDHYEVSNFCINGLRSKHNQAYWLGNKAFSGYGMGASSFIDGFRVTRPKKLKKYYEYIHQMSEHPLPCNYVAHLKNLSKFLQIHDENDKKESLKWVILSRLRRAQGILWEQLSLSENEKSKIIDTLIKINHENPHIFDMEALEERVKVKIPHGYLFIDEIGYRIIDCL